MSQNAGTRPRATGWVGWIAFAAAMLLVLGGLNLIHGFAAVFKDEIFITTGGQGAFVLDLTAWGWIHVVLGAIMIGVGIGLIQGAMWASITAIFLVMINMITQMFMLPAYPFWSILVIVLDAFVLYALIVHGDERIGEY